MMNKTKTSMTLMARAFGIMLMLMAETMTGYAQSDCFTYADNGNTITGLTDKGKAAKGLIIPSTVTSVNSRAFQDANSNLKNLIIDDGNPTFQSNLFGGRTNTLTKINMGSGMSVDNMHSLLLSLGSRGNLVTVEIEGYSGGNISWNDNSINNILTSNVNVVLPAAQVASQTFGNAKVYGHFTIEKEIISFCGNVTFQDVDNGSNMLFYVVDKLEDQRIHIQRVQYIVAGKGVLIHKTASTTGSVSLPRINNTYGTDASLYSSNMLVGVTADTPIEAVDGDKTNLVLKDGAFHPTSGGTIKANKAYLQIPTTQLPAGARLEISFPGEEMGLGSLTTNPSPNGEDWYDLSGRHLSGKPSAKGIYMNNGKKYVIK